MIYMANNHRYLPAVRNFRHEGVLETRREASATTAAQARFLDLVDDPVRTHGEDLLGLVPIATFESSIDPGALVLIKVGEYAVLVRQRAVLPHRCTS